MFASLAAVHPLGDVLIALPLSPVGFLNSGDLQMNRDDTVIPPEVALERFPGIMHLTYPDMPWAGSGTCYRPASFSPPPVRNLAIATQFRGVV